MTPEQIYASFIIKANANAQSNNRAVDKGRFVELYNEATNKFVEWVLDKRNEDDIRYIQPLLDSKKINGSSRKENYQLFKLPKDYFGFSNVYAYATGGCCAGVSLELVEIKSENEGKVLNNEDTKPSIDYRETPFYLQNNAVKVFVDNFKVDSVVLTYYKYATPIELINADDPESDFKNKDTNLELDKKAIDRIISIAISDYSLNINNPKYQADKARVVSKF